MGYYSKYEVLTMDEKTTPTNEVWEALVHHADNRREVEAAQEGEKVKWYDMRDHAELVSSEFPSWHFAILQEGEDGEISCRVFKNGISCLAAVKREIILKIDSNPEGLWFHDVQEVSVI